MRNTRKKFYKLNKRRYKRKISNTLFDKQDRQIFNAIRNIFEMILIVITTLYKTIYQIGAYVHKMYINYIALRKIGYNLVGMMNKIHNLSPRSFEIFISELFRQKGYSVYLTPESKDKGVDIILDNHIFVECKHYGNSKVTRPIIQKLLGSSMMYKGDKCIVVTTGEYTIDAYKCASIVDNLQLMDMVDIQKMILDLKPEQIARVFIKTENAS